MPVYFAYGSNMSSARLLARVGSARSLGAVHVGDWRLAFNKPGRDGTGKANLVPCEGSLAWGVLWRLGEPDWSALDRFEPGYQRASFRFERANGDSIAADAYLFDCGADAPTIAPSTEYVTCLLEGAQEHGLPPEYIEKIRSERSPR